MKKIAIVFILLFISGLTFIACTSQEEQAQTEKQILDEMNKSMQDMSTDMSIDTATTDSALLK
jgi:outer membrane lipoprotein-sorting protein